MEDAALHRHNDDLKIDGNRYIRPRRMVITLLTLSIQPQLFGRCSGFQTTPHATFVPRHLGTALHGLAVEDVVSVVASSEALWHQHLPTTGVLVAQLYTAVATTPSSATNFRPATGHSQPLFGPPDPYLTAGKSIAPSAKTLLDMGMDVSSKVDLRAPAGSLSVLDESKLSPISVLPGFATTRGILPTALPLPSDTPEMDLINTEWSLGFIDVIDKLPQAAFLYVLIEFFILRPNINLYKEDIEAEPGKVTVEWATVMVVRLATFAVVAMITNALYAL
jgi:hypothetical protein